MSEEIERLLLRVEANVIGAETALKKMNRTLHGTHHEVRKTLDSIKRDTTSLSARMFTPMGDALRREVAGLASIAATAFSVKQIAAYADSYTGLQNRLRATGLEGERLAGVEDALFAAASRNGMAVDAVAQMYQRASQARKQLAATDEQLLSLTNGITAALRVQGISATEASGPLLQLGQALGGGIVRSEELNSLLEGAPLILEAAANGSKKFKGDMQALTAAIRDGKVTSKEFFAALLQGLPELEQRAGSLPLTMGQALQILNNELGRYVGQTDKGLSASQRIAGAIEALAMNLDTVVPVVMTLAGVVGSSLVASLTAAASAKLAAGVAAVRLTGFNIAMTASMTGATRAQVALNMAIAANPIGLAVTVAAALAGGLYLLANRYNSTATAARALDRVVGAADTALDDYRQAVDAAKNASKAEREELEKKAAALREVARARIADAKVAAQKQVDEAVAARRTADEALRAANETRQRVGTNAGSNAGGALVDGSSALAQGAIDFAVRARAQADEALASWRRLEAAISNIEAPRRAEGAGGGGTGDGKGSGKASKDAERVANARAALDLEEQLAVARATGNDALIKAEEERQRLIELTERYRAAGYEDAANRAMGLLALENRAVEIAEEREARRARLQEQFEREQNTRRANAEWTERQYELEMELARRAGDDTRLRALEREADLRRRIAEYMERYGVAGIGLAIVEQNKADAADAQGEADMQARQAARAFVDVLASDNIWDEAGRRFRNAAWDGVEALLAQVFRAMNSGGDGGIVKTLFKSFAGGFATGGSFGAGQWAVVGERGAEAIRARPGGGVDVLSGGQLRGLNLAAGAARATNLNVSIDVTGANGDAAIRAIAEEATAKGVMVALGANRAERVRDMRQQRSRFV